MSNSDTSISSRSLEKANPIAIKRICWIGLLALVASVAINLLLRVLAISFFAIPAQFPSLQWGPPIGFTALRVIGAVLTFAAVYRWAPRPALLFQLIAPVILLLSFVPDIALRYHYNPPGFLAHFFEEDATIPATATLAAMHVTTYLITVGLLSGLIRKKGR